ncbi:hypothetical protein [Novosphingobium sp. NBM11]|uniref:hypothetical protein n=1 Tax=Novosphingobium sp. NBM11 TaxID=2596914 RepID=UPI001892260C|nr:hypothetical protein [Novosphingobium sp. NBM11]
MADKARSNRPEVRNPFLLLPSIQAFASLPPEVLTAMELILTDVSADARERANACWAKHKAPMAAYWKAKAVDARHLRLAIRKIGGAAA